MRVPAGAGAGDFRNFNFDFGAEFSPGRGGGIDPDILAEMFGGRTTGRGRGPVRGEDIPATVTVPLAMAAGGGSVRVTLSTGRSLDVAVPAGSKTESRIRLRGQGSPGARDKKELRNCDGNHCKPSLAFPFPPASGPGYLLLCSRKKYRMSSPTGSPPTCRSKVVTCPR